MEVRLAVFCLKQHFETDRDRFKTSNLFFRIAMSAAYRLKSLTAYWCFCLHSFSKSKYTEKKRLHLTLSRGGTPRKFQLYTIWPACTGSVFLGLNLEGEGITANWQFRLMAVSVELLDMGGEGSNFFQSKVVFFKAPFLFGKFFPLHWNLQSKMQISCFHSCIHTVQAVTAYTWLYTWWNHLVWYCF